MLRLILVAALGVAVWQAPQFQSRVDTVAIFPSVRDGSDRLVTNLTKEDFEVQVDGRAVDVTTFSIEALPLSIVLLLDMSSSMTPQFLMIRESGRRFVGSLGPRDRMRIGTFGGAEVALSPLMTGDRDVLNRILSEELWPGGSTPMWRALESGLRAVASEPQRRVIVILTDGEDFGGSDLRSSVEKLAERTETMIYAVGLPGSGLAGPVRELAAESGGGQFVLRADERLQDAFDALAQALRAQYVLGFAPPVLDGRTHSLKVRLHKRNLKVTAPTRIFLGERR